MTSQLVFPNPFQVDNNGELLIGGQIFTFEPGTDVEKTTYVDPGLTQANSQPLILDGTGRCNMYASGIFDIQLLDSLGNQLFRRQASTWLPDGTISAVMLPVVGAETLAAAQIAMGLPQLIAADIAAIHLLTGPTGPQGPQGVAGAAGGAGAQGIQGPTGPAGAGVTPWDGTGTPPVGSYIISQFQDFNPSDLTTFGTILPAQIIQPDPRSFGGTWQYMGGTGTLFLGDIYLHSYLTLRIS